MEPVVVATEEDEANNIPKKLDAGALFVLKSRGSWLHCGYHLTTSIVAPALLSLPYAPSLMGWFAGVICLTVSALVTFYSYNLLSLVLEHHAHLGQRQLRFRDMARDILGPRWGRYFVGPIQFGLCYGAVIACILLGGQSLKYIFLLSSSRPETMKLYQFVSIFGQVSFDVHDRNIFNNSLITILESTREILTLPVFTLLKSKGTT
ncbi:GABA transporter 1-like [Rosa rugosa]|uniref:GABA transporter 1-like n=1 Tax=Rosa rugosa TaxID=74645 RepID=UPI002B409655|nr:GABA transporter 1-like [Rosa rugosa]